MTIRHQVPGLARPRDYFWVGSSDVEQRFVKPQCGDSSPPRPADYKEPLTYGLSRVSNQTMSKTCEWCGGDLLGFSARFCSPACKNRGGVSAWRRRMRRRAVDYRGGKCQRCGYERCVAALVFYHPSGKVFRISDGIARSWELIKIELDKCELICMNCHAELHHAMSHKELPGEAERDRQLWIRAESPKSPKSPARKCIVCGKDVSPGSTRCRMCSSVSRRGVASKTTWPSLEELRNIVESDGYEAVGRTLGVTGKGVKKHILKYTMYAKKASEKSR